MLSDEIRVENDGDLGITPPYVENVQTSVTESRGEDKAESISLPAVKRPYQRYLFLLVVVLVVASLISFIIPISPASKTSIPQHQNTYSLGEIDGCKVESFTSSTPEAAQLKVSIIKSILETEKLSCPADSTLFFQSSDPVLYGATGRIFLSICRNNQSKESRYSSCYNFYEVSHAAQGN